MRQEYEAWFADKFGQQPMPLDSRQIDFCWHGYQAGVESTRDKQAEFPMMLDAERAKYVTREIKYEQHIAELERQRDELLAAASTFIFEWDNCKSSGEWPVRQLGVLRAAIQAAKEQGK